MRYYSRSGNTKAVAEAIAKAAGVSAVSVDQASAAIFPTSWISKHSLDLIRKGLMEKGIQAEAETFYVKSKPNETQLKDAAAFEEKFI